MFYNFNFVLYKINKKLLLGTFYQCLFIGLSRVLLWNGQVLNNCWKKFQRIMKINLILLNDSMTNRGIYVLYYTI